MIEKAEGRKVFELLYDSRINKGLEDIINVDREEGELKGIVGMAFMLHIITLKEMQAYYVEISKVYRKLKQEQKELDRIAN